MEERPYFVNQDLPIESREEPFGFDEFLARGVQIANEMVFRQDEPGRALAPLLLIANIGDLIATTWTEMSPDYREHFLDRLVPETLGSYDVSMVALLAASEGRRASGEVQEAVVLSGLDASLDGPAHEAAFAAAVYRSPDPPPRLGMFVEVADGLSPGIARALHQGLGLDAEGPE